MSAEIHHDRRRGDQGNALRITFLLPLAGTDPIGGFRVVYEYSNYLAARGNSVSIVHPAHLLIDEPLRHMPVKAAARTIKKYLVSNVTGSYKPTSWYKVAEAVKLLWVPSLAHRFIPDGDIVVATAWQTAEWAQHYPPKKGEKFYFIQHLETWSGPEERVLATWKMPLRKIVIAPWLQKKAETLGETAQLVLNGLNFDRFRVEVPIEARDPNSILMPYHEFDWKGTADGLAAFEIARQQVPGLKLTLFGLSQPPKILPSGVVYHEKPSQTVLRGLYNQAAIFVSPSWTEGFPLPPAEALQCGAAIVLTDIEGVAAYAFHERTALLSPVKDPNALAANLLRLVRDTDLRLRLARDGNAYIQEFTVERAGSLLATIFSSALKSAQQGVEISQR